MDVNASIQVVSAVTSAYAQSAAAKAPAMVSQPQAPKIPVQEDRFERSNPTSSLGATGATTSAKTKVTNTANNTDRVELSSSSQDLNPTTSNTKSTAKKVEDATIREPSQWSQERLAKLDHLALLVKEGNYHIEPFMVDEIALRLARAMASI